MAQVEPLMGRLQSLNEARTLGVVGAHEEMVETAGRLKVALQTPWETIREARYHTVNAICKRIAIEFGIIEKLCKQEGKPITALELSHETDHDAQVIERILRVLTHMDLVSEAGERSYLANEVTILMNTPSNVAHEKYLFDFLFPLGADLVKCIREMGLRQFPDAGEKGPFEYTFGAPLFEYLVRNPEMKRIFDLSMASRRQGASTHWFDTYPAITELGLDAHRPEVDDPVALIDVAGGRGHDIVAFSKAYPDFPGKLVLEDLPSTFTYLEAEDRQALTNAGVRLQEYDFFTPQPIKGAHAYFFRDICHDWPDKQAKQFLGTTAQAMTKGYSKLLIEDHVVDEQDAHYVAAASDVLMMLILTGIERTRQQWVDLLDSVDLQIVKIWPSRRGHQSVIEAMRK